MDSIVKNVMEHGQVYLGSRLVFRPIRESDGLLVSYWRNSPEARQMFFNSKVVTPDSHAEWLSRKSPYDLVWMIHDKDKLIGMIALTISACDFTGEYGRLIIDPSERDKGYGTEAEYMLICTAFELFELKYLWADVFEKNAAILKLHDSTGWTAVGDASRLGVQDKITRVKYFRNTWTERRTEVAKKYGWSLTEWKA